MATPSISVILNVYKRPHMLEPQLESILGQTVNVNPKNIHVWYNFSDVEQLSPSIPEVKTYVCNWNTKFFGRFTLPLLCRTKYIAIFDDDNLPGCKWFENCLNVINTEETNGVLGGTGVILKDTENFKVGWNGDTFDHTMRVDFIGQTWFFRQEWAKYMWYEPPICWDNGEDIMFCYLVQKYGGVNTFVPPHPTTDTDMWSTHFGTAWKVGRDGNASWRLGGHRAMRERIYQTCIKRGWNTVNG